MKTQVQPDEIASLPALTFAPIPLCLNDALPVSMVLVMGFSYRLDFFALRNSLKSALNVFPQLTGRIHLNLQPLQAELIMGDREILLEWIQSSPIELKDLEFIDQDTLFNYFAPTASSRGGSPMQFLQAPLLQLRLTWLEDNTSCVLGVMVSHMVLDGIGLALFLNHLTGAYQGRNGPEVLHNRQFTFPKIKPKDNSLPKHYSEIPNLSLIMAAEQDPIAFSQPIVFSVSFESLEKKLGSKSIIEAKLSLAALLSHNVAIQEERRRTLAIWCNTRGLGQIPRNYTGNTGCYIHSPLETGDWKTSYQNLKRAITRHGFSEIIDTYARLKSAESTGRYVFWNGPGEDLLSLNLVPHVPGVANFGNGDPVYAQLLTRNVSGLRLFNSLDGKRLIVEACLPTAIGERLMICCENQSLNLQVWHHHPA